MKIKKSDFDERIFNKLGEFRADSDSKKSTSFRVWEEGYSIHSWNGNLPNQRDTNMHPEIYQRALFSVFDYSATEFDGSNSSVTYNSKISTKEITVKQLDKLFWLMNRLFSNTKEAGLILGNVQQSINLGNDMVRRKDCTDLDIGPIQTVNDLNIDGFYQRLPNFSNFIVDSASNYFREEGAGKLICRFEFEDGIANMIRGDVAYRRLVYMDKLGNTGALESSQNDITLDEFLRRDLELKKLFGLIRI